MPWYLVKESGPITAVTSINLSGKDEISIGRNPEATVCIPSITVSRIHAVLTRDDESWYILDNKSLNGVFVNSQKLEPMTRHKLENGDVIHLSLHADRGCGGSKDEVCSYRVRYVSKPFDNQSEDKREGKQLKLMDLSEDGSSSPIDGLDLRDAMVPGMAPCATEQDKWRGIDSTSHRGHVAAGAGHKWAESTTATAEGSVSHHCAGGASSHQSAQGPAGSSFVVACDNALPSPGYGTASPVRSVHDHQTADCNRAKCSPCGEGAQQHDFSELSGEPLSKRACLVSGKAAHRLQQHGEISMAVCGSDKTLGHSHDELVASLMARAEQLAHAAEEEALRRRQLEQQLMVAQQQSEVLRQEVQKARDEALEGVAQLAENELQCCICNELPIKAKSLSCSHSFCSYCIDQWLQKKKECPVCRERVRASTLSYALDSYIEKVMEQMPAEKQAARRELVEQRRREEESSSAKSSHRQKLSGRSSASTRSSARSAVVSGASASHQRSMRDHMLAAPQVYSADVPELWDILARNVSAELAFSEAWPVLDALVAQSLQGDEAEERNMLSEAAAAAAGAEPLSVSRRTGAAAGSVRDADHADPIVVHDDSSEEEGEESDMDSGEEVSLSDDDVDSSRVDGTEEDGGDTDDAGDGVEYVPGMSGAYYGGYGSCFRCGNRGHWANGCPYR